MVREKELDEKQQTLQNGTRFQFDKKRSQAWVSVERIDAFLQLPELKAIAMTVPSTAGDDGGSNGSGKAPQPPPSKMNGDHKKNGAIARKDMSAGQKKV